MAYQYGNPGNPGPGENPGPPPMGPGPGPEMAPPSPGPGPGPEGAAAPGGAPTPEELMAQVEQEQMARAEAIMAALPEPEEALEVKLLQNIIDKLNELAVAVAGEDMAQPLMFEPAEGEKKLNMLPPEVAVPLMMAIGAIQDIGNAAGIDVSKYILDPSELASNAGLRKAAGLLDMIMKDAALMEALGPQAGPDMEAMPEDLPEEMPEEMPDEFTEEDEALMEMM